MTVQILDEHDIRRIAREEAQRPEYVTQRNVEEVIGLPRRDYLRLARARAFQSTKERRLTIARTADVLAVFEMRIATASAVPSNDASAEAHEFARVGARRVAQ